MLGCGRTCVAALAAIDHFLQAIRSPSQTLQAQQRRPAGWEQEAGKPLQKKISSDVNEGSKVDVFLARCVKRLLGFFSMKDPVVQNEGSTAV